MSHLSYARHDPNFMALLLRDHQRYLPIVEFLDKLIQGAAELSWAECERLFTHISETNGSGFCAGIHQGVASALRAPETAKDRDRFAPVLALAAKLNRHAGSVSEQDIQSVLDAGWREQTVEDTAGLVAIINVYNILANGLGFKALPQAAFLEMGKATVQQQGYTPMFRAFIEHAQA